MFKKIIVISFFVSMLGVSLKAFSPSQYLIGLKKYLPSKQLISHTSPILLGASAPILSTLNNKTKLSSSQYELLYNLSGVGYSLASSQSKLERTCLGMRLGSSFFSDKPSIGLLGLSTVVLATSIGIRKGLSLKQLILLSSCSGIIRDYISNKRVKKLIGGLSLGFDLATLNKGILELFYGFRLRNQHNLQLARAERERIMSTLVMGNI